MRTIARAFQLLTVRERGQFYWLIPGVMVMALLKTLGVAAVFPFLELLARPSAIQDNAILKRVYEWSGLLSVNRFMFAAGVLVLVLLALGNAFSMVIDWLLLRFAWMRNHTISQRLLTEYLNKGYEYFMLNNGAVLIKNLTSEVQSVVQGILVPAVQAVANATVAVCILVLLVSVNPGTAAVVTLTLGASYVAIYLLARKRLGIHGQSRTNANTDRYIAASEAVGGAKEIILTGSTPYFQKQFFEASKQYAHHSALSDVIALLPRYALETIAFGGIIVIVLIELTRGTEMATILSLLGLYAIAGYRLMPSLQQVYAAITKSRFNAVSLDVVAAGFDLTASDPPSLLSDDLTPPSFDDAMEVRSVSYTYPSSDRPVLRNVSLTVRNGTTVALVGETGSGKSTLVDILLGLLQPSSGGIYLDGVLLDESNVRGWQRTIGYVPQDIYLADTSIAQNIAFGRDGGLVDMARVTRAAAIAEIDVFIRMDLPDGYQTTVGDRGVRLSGGQLQRIGIARALYADPRILLLDEATSALDASTEARVLTKLRALGRTTIMVSHRLTTVRDCDTVFMISEGKIAASGTFGQVFGEDGNPHITLEASSD